MNKKTSVKDPVDPQQLKDVHIQVVMPEKDEK